MAFARLYKKHKSLLMRDWSRYTAMTLPSSFLHKLDSKSAGQNFSFNASNRYKSGSTERLIQTQVSSCHNNKMKFPSAPQELQLNSYPDTRKISNSHVVHFKNNAAIRGKDKISARNTRHIPQSLIQDTSLSC